MKAPEDDDASLTDFSVEQTERNPPGEAEDEDKREIYVSQMLSQTDKNKN